MTKAGAARTASILSGSAAVNVAPALSIVAVAAYWRLTSGLSSSAPSPSAASDASAMQLRHEALHTGDVQAWEAFGGVWERVRRARTHRGAAAREWSSWLAEYEPYGPWLDVDDEGNGTLAIRQYSPISPAIAIELGEWLYNLRAALDYTAYAGQAQANAGGQP